MVKELPSAYATSSNDPLKQWGYMVDISLGILGRTFFAFFKINGYFLIFIVETVWYLRHRKPEMIGQAIGDFGREVVKELANIIKPEKQ